MLDRIVELLLGGYGDLIQGLLRSGINRVSCCWR